MGKSVINVLARNEGTLTITEPPSSTIILPQYLDKARNLAFKSTAINYKVGAVIARGSYILGCGRNAPFSKKPGAKANGRSVHAEMDAVFKSRGDLDDAVIYIFVLTQRNHPGFSRPCDECQTIIKASGITTIVYSARGKLVVERI